MSLGTNIVMALIFALGLLQFPGSEYFFAIGAFGMSGALTNWIAVHMLFEKVPGLYGSGVIEMKFEQFKAGIRSLVVKEFFEGEHLAEKMGPSDERLAGLFDQLVTVIKNSPFGAMLGMFGGEQALEPLRVPFQTAVKDYLSNNADSFREKILEIIDHRLDELTPNQVKTIVEDMIRKHLGWLVVWGGVFGGLIGLLVEVSR